MAYIHIHDFYPHPNRMRYGRILDKHAGINFVLEQGRDEYRSFLEKTAVRHLARFMALGFAKQDEVTPYWDNGFFPFLDIVALFGLIAERKPKLYVEVGSGNSTKVAEFARKSVPVDFRLISIDPEPRAEIDAICDDVIRRPLQDCDLSVFDQLEAGDILFFDGSHRVLQNSDNEVLFFEIIPRLKPGVLIHIHDINWPYDYPDEWSDRYYNEQYVLGAMLLYAPGMFRIVFPGTYVAETVPYDDLFGGIWKRPGYEGMQKHGCSFWFEKTAQNAALEKV